MAADLGGARPPGGPVRRSLGEGGPLGDRPLPSLGSEWQIGQLGFYPCSSVV